MTGLLTWNDSGILVLFNVGLLGAVPQGVGVVLLHRIVELHLVVAKFSISKKSIRFCHSGRRVMHWSN